MRRSKLNPHARGAFLGLAIGDAAGAPREFSRPEAPPFPKLVTGPHNLMTGGGPFDLAPSQTTDDTALCLCLWQSLCACGGFSSADAARRYVEWERITFDAGGQTRAALGLISGGMRSDEAGRKVWESRGRDAAGNGSLMRTAPIGVIFAENPEACRAASLADSGITHYDPRCQIACAAFNAAIALACSAEGKAKATDLLVTADKEIDLASNVVRNDIEAELVEAARTALHEDLRLAREPDPKLYGPEIHLLDQQGYVRVAFRSSFWHVVHTPTFEAGVADTVLRGGDADTVGCITGALLGALHGEKAIPKDWVEAILKAKGTPATREVAERYHPRLFFSE